MDTGAAVKEGLAVIQQHMPETYKAVKRKAQEIGTPAYALVRRGLKGEANCFWACERGHVVGTPFTESQAIQGDVARLMVQFGCSFVVVWARPVEVAA